MTPAEISVLADAVEAETAADEQVAVVFGWEPTNTYQGVIWTRGYEWSECPPMTTDLNALAAECARRGYYPKIWRETPERWAANIGAGNRHISQNCYAPTPAPALCSALLRALAADKEATDD